MNGVFWAFVVQGPMVWIVVQLAGPIGHPRPGWLVSSLFFVVYALLNSVAGYSIARAVR